MSSIQNIHALHTGRGHASYRSPGLHSRAHGDRDESHVPPSYCSQQDRVLHASKYDWIRGFLAREGRSSRINGQYMRVQDCSKETASE